MGCELQIEGGNVLGINFDRDLDQGVSVMDNALRVRNQAGKVQVGVNFGAFPADPNGGSLEVCVLCECSQIVQLRHGAVRVWMCGVFFWCGG